MLVSDTEKLKIFQISKGGNNVSLIYLTPKYIAIDPKSGQRNNDKFNFVEKTPIRSVCFLDAPVTFHRKDFLKVPVDEKVEYPLNVRVPINLYKFDAVKVS